MLQSLKEKCQVMGLTNKTKVMSVDKHSTAHMQTHTEYTCI